MPFLPWVQTAGNAPVPLSPANGGTGGQLPWAPADDGFLGFNEDPGTASGGGLIVAGSAYLARLPLRTPQLISNLWFCVTAAGVGASTGSFIWIISGATGAVLAQSADIATQLTGTGWQSAAMTAPVTVGGGTFPYAVILSNLATTQPTLLRALNTANNSPQVTANVAALRWSVKAAFGTAVGAVILSGVTTTSFSNLVGWS